MKATEFNEIVANKEIVIFDFGGIFVDIDYNEAVKNLSKLSKDKNADSLYTKKKQVSFFNDFETGKITPDEFISELRKSLSIEAGDKEIRGAWNSMLREIQVDRINYLRELRKTKKVYMLSNINQIHEEFLEEYINSNSELKSFYSEFDEVYFSHKIGFRKPEKEAFIHVIDSNRIDIKKAIFIDDSPQHVEGAITIGLDAILLDPPNSFIVSKY